MRKTFVILVLQLFIVTSYCQDKPSHIIYNAKGKRVSYKKMLKTLKTKDILLFGELHDNPIAHWLQYEVTADLNMSRKLILGAEMFEADNQEALNKYLKGDIDYKGLDSLARLWPNNRTDYAPLVDFAKEKQLLFIASNIPRRYASLVYKNGFEILDSLPDEEKAWIAPLPIPFDSELETYKNILKMMGGHGSPKLVMAQAIKDATMASFILKNYKKDHLFIHYNGAYHSDSYEGIMWYLKQERKSINVVTISTISQENVGKLLKENQNKADFIICVDSDMTSTY